MRITLINHQTQEMLEISNVQRFYVSHGWVSIINTDESGKEYRNQFDLDEYVMSYRQEKVETQ